MCNDEKAKQTFLQHLLMNSKTVSNNCLRKPGAYQRACELKLPGPRLITRSKLERFLQNVMTINSRDRFHNFQH